MICFDLCCGKGHRFEGWFSSSGDYDLQLSNGLVTCPLCNDVSVQKLLSVPNIGRKGTRPARQIENAGGEPEAAVAPTANGLVVNAPTLPQAMSDMMQKMATAQSEMLKSSEWVGPKFAETARAIYYGETEQRLIHGEASRQEAEALAEEGVAVAALPFPFVPPKAKN
jgi:hypothetical protein